MVFKDLYINIISESSKTDVYRRENEVTTVEKVDKLFAVWIDSSSFDLHSLRIGKATAAAENNVSERLIKIHGGWKTEHAETIISKIQ